MKKHFERRQPDKSLPIGDCDISYSGGRYVGPCRIVQRMGPEVLIRFRSYDGKLRQIVVPASCVSTNEKGFPHGDQHRL